MLMPFTDRVLNWLPFRLIMSTDLRFGQIIISVLWQRGMNDIPVLGSVESLKAAEQSGYAISKDTLVTAITYNCLPVVQYLLEERPRLWDQASNCYTLAARHGHIALLDYLLSNRKCMNIESVLISSASAGKLDVFKWLMNRYRVDEFHGLPWVALEYAGRTGDWSMFDYLMENGGHKGSDLCVQAAKWGLPALKKVRRDNVPWYKDDLLSKVDLTDQVRVYIEQNPIEGDM
jgi:hypothetical protein